MMSKCNKIKNKILLEIEQLSANLNVDMSNLLEMAATAQKKE